MRALKTAATLCLALVAPAVAVLQHTSARAQEQATGQALVIVLDGSGSMWGKLADTGKTKLEISQRVLTEAIGKTGPDITLGLSSFGHRRSGNCSDADYVVSPAANSAENINQQIAKHNPRGKGPLTLALRKSIAAIPGGGKGVLLVIHDGLDNCRLNPCDAAKEIKASHPGMKIHVASLGLPANEAAAMQCLAAETEGVASNVANEAELQAAVEKAFAAAAIAPPVAATNPAANQTGGAATSSQPGLRLTAHLGADGKSQPVAGVWTVAAADGNETAILVREGSTLDASLEPGPYRIRFKSGFSDQTLEIEVPEKGRLEKTIALGAGILQFPASDPADIGQGRLPAFHTVRPSAAPDADPAPEANGKGAPSSAPPIWISYSQQDSQLIVPAGTYDIESERGQTLKTTRATVRPGDIVRVAGDADSGTLRVASSTAGSSTQEQESDNALSTEPVLYVVSTDDPQAKGGRREVARSAAPNASFQLVAGTYYVTARLGQAEKEARLAITAGGSLDHVFTFDMVRVTFSATIGGKPVPQDIPVTFRLSSLEEAPREVARASNAQPSLLVPTGRYRVVAEIAQGLEAASQVVDIAAANTGQLKVPLKAGLVTLKPAEGTALRQHRLQIRSAKDVIIWRGRLGRSETIMLPPGLYTVRAGRAGSGTGGQTLEVRDGQNTEVEVRPKS